MKSPGAQLNGFPAKFTPDVAAAAKAALVRMRPRLPGALDRTEESELGEFGWVMDPEGHRLELWQPPPIDTL